MHHMSTDPADLGFEPLLTTTGEWPCDTCGGPLGSEGRDGQCGDCTQADYDAEHEF